ncbi:hypothetical protein OY671_013023, partial [Metschnikowia pulcherrima]
PTCSRTVPRPGSSRTARTARAWPRGSPRCASPTTSRCGTTPGRSPSWAPPRPCPAGRTAPCGWTRGRASGRAAGPTRPIRIRRPTRVRTGPGASTSSPGPTSRPPSARSARAGSRAGPWRARRRPRRCASRPAAPAGPSTWTTA